MARSFFERLTGSVRLNEEEDDALRGKKASLAPRFKRKTEESDMKSKMFQAPAAEESEGREVSLPTDEEGQLTVDIYDDGTNIVIQSTIAGVKPEDIDISLQDETLTVRGSRKRAQEVKEDNFYYRELYWGSFSRSIILPEEVDFQRADASIKNGLLTVRLPKKDKGEKKLRVKTE